MIIRIYGKWLVYVKHLIKLICKTFRIKFNLFGYCRDCGRRVHDFIVPDDIWQKVTGRKGGGGCFCYDCFCARADKKRIRSRLSFKGIIK